MVTDLLGWLNLYKAFLVQNRTRKDTFDLMIRWHAIYITALVNLDEVEHRLSRFARVEELVVSPEVQELQTWAATPAARRALLHAASIRRLFDTKAKSAQSALHVQSCLYIATIILQLYAFLVPANNPIRFPLDDADAIDHLRLGLTGLHQTDGGVALPSSTPNVILMPQDFVDRGATPTLEGVILAKCPNLPLTNPELPYFAGSLVHRTRNALYLLNPEWSLPNIRK